MSDSGRNGPGLPPENQEHFSTMQTVGPLPHLLYSNCCILATLFLEKSTMELGLSNGIPAPEGIQAAILKCMDSRQLKAGDLVDSERELAKIHRVSLMTPRHALAGLERERTVGRCRGAGTFVAAPKIHFNKLISFSEQMADRGLVARSRVLSISPIGNEQEVAARLALPAGSRLIRIERLGLGAEEPFALETCYLSGEKFGALVRVSLKRGSLSAFLDRGYAVSLAHAGAEIDATIADPQSARLMCVARHSPLLRIRQVIYCSKGKATAFVLGLYRSSRHTLLIRSYR
jgi:GntR family transcriptional regulator